LEAEEGPHVERGKEWDGRDLRCGEKDIKDRVKSRRRGWTVVRSKF
jgi:hypothetical protein